MGEAVQTELDQKKRINKSGLARLVYIQEYTPYSAEDNMAKNCGIGNEKDEPQLGHHPEAGQ